MKPVVSLVEFMPEVFTRSEVLPLDFADILTSDRQKDMRQYVLDNKQNSEDPRSPRRRQEFNTKTLEVIRARYLIGRYAESRADILGADSHMVREGRVYHLAIDVFSRDLEPVYAPCDGEIVRSQYEPGEHNFGNYVILRPDDAMLPYIFFGHLAHDRIDVGRVHAGDRIGTLGSYENLENGGWSVHLHLQLLMELPLEGEAPIGYSTYDALEHNMQRFPDPQSIFPEWQIKR